MSTSRPLLRRAPLLTALAGLAALGCRTSTGPEHPLTHPTGEIFVRSASLTGRPFGVAVSPADSVFVGLQDESRLAVLRLRPATSPGSISVGDVPTDVRVSPGGALVAVSNQMSGSVGLVNLTGGAPVTTVQTSANPFRVLFSRDGQKLYVSNNSGIVDIVDVSSRTVVASIVAGQAVNGLALSPDGRSLYATSMTGGIAVVELSSNQIARTIPLPGVPQGIAVSPDGSELYVANEGDATVAVIDARVGFVKQRIAVGSGAFDMSLSPDGAQLYVTLPQSGAVAVIDRADKSVISSIMVGGTPRRVAFTVTGDAAVVSNEAGWVDVIR